MNKLEPKVKVIQDSIINDTRLITVECICWKPILNYLLRYKEFSICWKNLSNDFANMHYPTNWFNSKNDLLTVGVPELNSIWSTAVTQAVFTTKIFNELDIKDVYTNLFIEPFIGVKCVISAYYIDWLKLINSYIKDIDLPEAKELIDLIDNAITKSIPVTLLENQWHLPYINAEERNSIDNKIELALASCARCARVDRKLNNELTTIDEDASICQDLINQHKIYILDFACKASKPIKQNNTLQFIQLGKIYNNELL